MKMIVHLLIDEKFTSDFIDLVDHEFNQNREHVFLVVTKHEKLRYEISSKAEKIFIRQDIPSIFRLIYYLIRADKIITHGLFNPYLIYMLYFLHVSHKVVWAIWGGDLYDYKNEKGVLKFVKKRVIMKFYGAMTPVPGDADLSRVIYGFRGKYYPCMLYLSNVIIGKDNNNRDCDNYTILVGNSADSENRHKYILEKLKTLNLKNVRFVIPLSYGDQSYADEIEAAYKAEYGENAICLRRFMPKEEYIKLLSSVDVVLFSHRRQQGVGNLVQLINLGAKVYLEPYVTTFDWLLGLGIKVFDFESVDDTVMIPLTTEEKTSNREIIRSIASVEKLVQQLKLVFDDCG